VFTYPLQIAPANNVLESYLFGGWEKGKKRQCGKNISRTVVVFLSCLVVVVLYDYISELLEIVAALTAIPMAFMLPPLFHLKLENLSTCAKIADWLFIAFALITAVYCAYNGTVTLIEKLGEAEE
jgi:amino acid permease